MTRLGSADTRQNGRVEPAKTKQPGIAARLLVLCYAIGLLAVLLDARGAQPGKAVAVD
jgi:hypothetical protein